MLEIVNYIFNNYYKSAKIPILVPWIMSIWHIKSIDKWLRNGTTNSPLSICLAHVHFICVNILSCCFLLTHQRSFISGTVERLRPSF